MKYSKTYKHSDGKHYVMMGKKKFLLNTVSETEDEAKAKCATRSAEYHLLEALKCMKDKAGLDLISKGARAGNYEYENLLTSIGDLKDLIEDVHQKHSDYDENDPCYWI